MENTKKKDFSCDMSIESEIVALNLLEIAVTLPRAFADRNWDALASAGQSIRILETAIHDIFGYAHSKYISGEVHTGNGVKWDSLGNPKMTRQLAKLSKRFVNELENFIVKTFTLELEMSIYDLIYLSKNSSVIYVPPMILAAKQNGGIVEDVYVWKTPLKPRKCGPWYDY